MPKKIKANKNNFFIIKIIYTPKYNKCKFDLFKRFRNSRTEGRGYAYNLVTVRA
jgi:hypothetical protein